MSLLRRKSIVQTTRRHNQSKGSMSYHAIIKVDDKDKLRIIGTELKNLKKERFQVKVEKDVEISAEDATALKTALNTVSKILEVYEKMVKVK